MLVLNRARGERIVIDGGRIVITLVECSVGKARIGIDAPLDVTIDREEIHLDKLRDRAEAGRAGGRGK